MEPAVESYYQYALAVSKRTRIFYSDDRRDAMEFKSYCGGLSPVTIFRWRHTLVKGGWFEPLQKGRNQERNPKTGFFLPIKYHVLTHDEWAQKHPDKCFIRLPSPATDSVAGPSPDSVAGPATDLQATGYSFMGSPAAESVAKSVVSLKSVKKEENKERPVAPQNGASGPVTLSVLMARLKTVFQEQTGQLPTWRQTDWNAIERLLRERADLDAEEFATRYEHFLTSELPFHRQQGGDLRFFARHFDKFIDAVTTDARLEREKRTFRNLGLPHSGDRRSPAAVPRPEGKEYPKPKRYEV